MEIVNGMSQDSKRCILIDRMSSDILKGDKREGLLTEILFGKERREGGGKCTGAYRVGPKFVRLKKIQCSSAPRLLVNKLWHPGFQRMIWIWCLWLFDRYLGTLCCHHYIGGMHGFLSPGGLGTIRVIPLNPVLRWSWLAWSVVDFR